MNQIVTFSSSEQINRFRPSQAEVERRYNNLRAAMEEHGLDALVVSGSEYSGFEGAVRYLTGFYILHRYAYVVIPANGDPVADVTLGPALTPGVHAVLMLNPGGWMSNELPIVVQDPAANPPPAP